MDGIKADERIGDMWLGLDEYYPSGTEVQVYLKLDEKNNDLKVTATLKNNPSVKVSCTFSRGNSDEKINQELEQAIAQLNTQDLTAFGVEAALKLAVPVVKATNQIIAPRTGEERIDMRDRAQANLKKFKVSMSEERLKAEYLAGECQRVIMLCGSSVIPHPQQQRLQGLTLQLEDAIQSNNESAMQSLSEEAQQELDRLPDEVQLVSACRIAIGRANAVDPTKASVMADKLSRMVSALESRDGREADRLWRELYPDVNHWLDRELPSNSIVTGLTP